MIVLDTHIWVWWVHRDSHLPSDYQAYIQSQVPNGLGVSVFSCWEIAKLDTLGRLILPLPISDWLNFALAEPGLRLLDLTTEIAVEANHLPGQFHRDPADQLIVATARVHNCPLVTMDEAIRNYQHVQTAP
ncbi:MAG: type II toxin-antitoxin system VapC family toxin [Blastocatellales bacterium]